MTSTGVSPGLNPNTHRTTISTTPHPSSSSRTPFSVGQSHAPLLRSLNARSPAVQDVRTPSPNYFGLAVEPANNSLSSAVGEHARGNWSPPTSNVRSTAAASPRVMPHDQNPEYEAFRKQSERHGFNSRSLSGFQMGVPPTVRQSSQTSSTPAGLISPTSTALPASPKASIPSFKHADNTQRSPKRLLSSPVPHIFDSPRRNSPAGFTDREQREAPQAVQFLRQERDIRFSLPPTTGPRTAATLQNRADTLPAAMDDQVAGDGKNGSPALISPQQVADIIQSGEALILDLRVSTQYARARIAGALNLCIPTTLLKRISYDTSKLSETFKIPEQREQFEQWRDCKHIIVYDVNSSKIKDATPCVKMLEKFVKEGFNGGVWIVRGGFTDISMRFPNLVDDSVGGGAMMSDSTLSPGQGNTLPAVIGGCPMPITQNAANPFFSNIRQNTDLIGGVGQISLKRPASMNLQMEESLPKWLKTAAIASDEGKSVAAKFLKIEKNEQKRMQNALSGNVSYGTPKADALKPVQLAGIEKGQKNRYNNIWPFEHSRVKLQGVPMSGCDYFNANHVKADWSNKRYIATQGPIPATFNDFWNVVWQQDARVIVMLTAESEGGQLKAHNYWSDSQFGPLKLNFHSEKRASLEPSRIHRHRERPSMGQRRSTTSTSGRSAPSNVASPTSEQPYVIVRRFTLSHSNEPFARMREITQLQYSHWPDFGAPAHPTHLLGLVEQCDAVVRASTGSSNGSPVPEGSRPIVVHCSAGCGRTGTFCTVDSVIDMMKRQRREAPSSADAASPKRHSRQPTPMDLDRSSLAFSPSSASPVWAAPDDSWVRNDDVDLIAKTVEDFRMQRLSMVQSLRQFVLCYESLLEWLCEQTPKSA
ncbi:hypothetical protein BLS_001533 [Venturia inaequalis]|uniref:protein-tyrosine-phosphatase n=1 Tax=Venturia inaequalis TaxID=5025 RepID=A0A8H3Z1F9_VENIN|nr:hypothetical protein BLS_001533 [Venturia inaequalis]KAE9993289.1 hypothetical protein EG327_005700 [Venturia inaequalis]